MIRSLRALDLCLIGLTVTNLAQVHLAGVVTTLWLAPLYALTLISPWLADLREHWTYRAAWNGAVIVLFAVLVQHASSGIRHLLEDGVLLAVFCQVHLLNNVTAKQKHDLLFFNAFLLAVVTSFFHEEVTFAVLFVPQAALLVLALLLSGQPAGKMPPGVVRDAIAKTLTALACTAALFAFVPRDFSRPGFAEKHFRPRFDATVGFNEQVDLGRASSVSRSDRIAVRAKLLQGNHDDVPAHWRGATLATFDGRRWHEQRASRGWNGGWELIGPNELRRSEQTPRAILRVTVDNRTQGRLFTPLTAIAIQTDADCALGTMPDGSLLAMTDPSAEDLNYAIELAAENSAEAADTSRELTQVAPWMLGVDGRKLAEQLAAETTGMDRLATADHFAQHLASEYRYLLPGENGAARDLTDFLGGARAGHCEFFATALAMLLRTREIECRLATGYLATEWHEDELVLRDSDAHAWVEVLGDDGHWHAVDATPAAEVAAADGESWWQNLMTALRERWQAVLRFDNNTQATVWAWLRGPGLVAVAGVIALLALLTLRRRQRRGLTAQARALLRAATAAGVPPTGGETPRELLARAQTQAAAPARLQALQLAVRSHERARYAKSNPH